MLKNLLFTMIVVSGLSGNIYPLDRIERADTAYQDGNYTNFLREMRAAVSDAPTEPAILYRLARAYALAGEQGNALEVLARLADIGADNVDMINSEEDFSSLRRLPQFQTILNRIESLGIPIRTSRIAYVLQERDLVPEGTAYDPVTDTLFISSLRKRKIVAISPEGGVRDFITEKSDGIWNVLGMKVDRERRFLWAVSSSPNQANLLLDALPGETGRTGIFKYDLDTGRLVKKYIPSERQNVGFFNDLVIAASGDVYITDTGNSGVWKIPYASDELEFFLPPFPNRRSYNGITISSDDRYLFLAHEIGISLLDLQTGRISDLMHSTEIYLGNVDGLSFYNNSLIAHQNSLKSVNRYYLSTDYLTVIRREIIDYNLPEFNRLTTGAIAGSKYFYIGNAQVRNRDNNGWWPTNKFTNITIFSNQLN